MSEHTEASAGSPSPWRGVLPAPRMSPRLFTAIDVAATGVFGLEGGVAAARAGFDLLGVVVVAFIVALGGGILRDVLLGDTPPAAFRSPLRVVVALASGALAFGAALAWDGVPAGPLVVLDAVGLALFAVTGAQKASEHGMSLWIVGALGTLTATGGGIIRDMLLGQVPAVLSESIYGTAALAGSVLAGGMLRSPALRPFAVLAGFLVCLILRLAAYFGGWELPRLTI
ncbi:putative membrane protein YeiH [Microbacterium resistens]|uniref:Membrane protein YeiH n=1 Tax=Microbacterium resistens TaxID=156977 RepID=A0ABU1SF51_9MICO|nr:trimeric intracellular cation channel family protein [Microbacterium resistens]MDR6867563.1 putative membrane protein YeiH [Microbacterium resistens]